MQFAIVVPGGDPILHHVFPSKQKAVQTVISIAKSEPIVEKVILFGSATSMRCGPQSDIDVAVVADVSDDNFLKIAHRLYVEVPSEIDVNHLNTVRSELLKQEINKGVVIYQRPY